MAISIIEFREWQKHKVTQAIYATLEEATKLVKEEMCSVSLPFQSDCVARLAELHGILEGIDTVLSMTFEEVISTESIEDDEEPTTGRA